MITSNNLKRERTDSKASPVPRKRKRKIGKYRPRKRPRAQSDNKEPKVKRARKVEPLQPVSPEVDKTADNKNMDLQHVSD